MYEKLIEELRETAEYIGPNNYELPIMLYDNLLKAADAIEGLSRSEAVALEYGADEHNRRLALEQRYRWIPVEERLPEDTTQVLVYSGIFAPFAEVAFYDGLWYSAWDGETEIAAVTHWMQLPPPPKEE